MPDTPPTGDYRADPSSLPTSAETPGTQIGPYKLLQLLGEGGMGSVYMAEQAVPVRRRVALKVIKPGMDSRQVVARFEAERQALALMDHPNIAKVLDAGTTPEGRPFFVMELVKGVPITRYCDEAKLTPRERLELFVPVCQAVQHAHQKGVIHRDLKPSNVLVTLYDGQPVPKVIDFGVAKALHAPLTERTMFTEFGAVVGTFEYMAPEQAEMSALDVDTRADVYALGVLLYELLTGTTPLTRERLRASALGEVLRLIREEEPPKPSTRLSTAEGLTAIAERRRTEPAKLGRLVRGELDWIAMKALDKERSRRYESASALAADVTRYLVGEPVQAGPASLGYRAKKFVRKHRGPVVAAGLVLAGLFVGLAGAAWAVVAGRQTELAERAERAERARADIEEARSKESAAESRRRSDRLLVQEGLRRADAGDLFGALPFFVRPLELGGLTADEERIHRTRIACYLRHTPGRPCLRQVFSYDTPIRHAEFSPDGRQMLLVGERWVRIVDSATGAAFVSKTLTFPVDAARYGADGSSVLVTSGPTIWSLNAATGEPVRAPLIAWDAIVRNSWTLPPVSAWEFIGQLGTKPFSRDGAFTTAGRVTFAADGRTAMIASGEFARMWDVASAQPIGPEMTLAEPISFVAINPVGSVVLLAGTTVARLFDATRATPIGREIRLAKSLSCASFTPDGRFVLIGSYDDSINAWDAATGERTAQGIEFDQSPEDISWSPDGTRGLSLVNGSPKDESHEHDVALWRWAGHFFLGRRLAHRWMVYCTAFGPDGRSVITGSIDHAVRLWDVRSGHPVGPQLEHQDAISEVSFDPSARYFAAVCQDGTCRVWDRASGGNGESTSTAEQALPAAIDNHAATSGMGALSSWYGGSLSDAASRELVALTGVKDARGAVAFSPRGQFALTRDFGHNSNDEYWLWDRRTHRRIGTAIARNGSAFATFSPDDRSFVVAFDDGARVYETATGGAITPLLSHGRNVVHVAFRPDGRFVATASWDGTTRLWSVADGRSVAPPLVHSSAVNRVAFDANGRRVATASADLTARIWDATTGAPLTSSLRHTGAVRDVAFSPNGRWLATATESHWRLWDTATGEPVSPNVARAASSMDLAFTFSTDGRRLSDGTGTWDIAPDSSPIDFLRDLAALYSGHDLDATGTPIRWAAGEVSSRWRGLRERRPEEFQVRPEAAIAWRESVFDSPDVSDNKAAVSLHRRWLATELRAAGWRPKPDEEKFTRLHAYAAFGPATVATEAADALIRKYPDSDSMLYDAAKTFSLAAGAAKDAASADRDASRAVALLRDAFAAGYSNARELVSNADFEPLRKRADFADLLWELAEAPAK